MKDFKSEQIFWRKITGVVMVAAICIIGWGYFLIIESMKTI